MLIWCEIKLAVPLFPHIRQQRSTRKDQKTRRKENTLDWRLSTEHLSRGESVHVQAASFPSPRRGVRLCVLKDSLSESELTGTPDENSNQEVEKRLPLCSLFLLAVFKKIKNKSYHL